MVMDEFYVGSCKTILLFPGAQASWDSAESLVPPAKKGKTGKKSDGRTQFRARIKHYADRGQLQFPGHMNSEGEGCFVIKANCGLRAWGWPQHLNGKAVFIISHVVLKKTRKADPADLARTIAARKQVQEELK
jgi:hypothetical protein